MYRNGFGRRGSSRERRRRGPRSRAAGCLLWVVLLIVLLIVLSVLFGGFQKGTRYKGLGPTLVPHPPIASQLSALRAEVAA